jgi:ubiquinone/menaquinone biosynthesis C-methylase UbiE
MTKDRCDKQSLSIVYSAGAESYDTTWSPVILPPAQAVVAALALADARRVLDIGAGTGALVDVIRDAAPRAHVVPIDPSSEMIRYARDHRRATVVLGDAMALPFPDGCVDAVVLAYVLFHLIDPVAGVREAVRTLRPGGRIGAVTWHREWPSQASKVWDETFERFDVPLMAAHGNHVGLDTIEAIERVLTAGGVSPARVWYESIEHAFSPASFWELRRGHGTTRARLAALDDASRGQVLLDLRRRLGPLEPDDYVFRGQLVCAFGEVPQR